MGIMDLLKKKKQDSPSFGSVDLPPMPSAPEQEGLSSMQQQSQNQFEFPDIKLPEQPLQQSRPPQGTTNLPNLDDIEGINSVPDIPPSDVPFSFDAVESAVPPEIPLPEKSWGSVPVKSKQQPEHEFFPMPPKQEPPAPIQKTADSGKDVYSGFTGNIPGIRPDIPVFEDWQGSKNNNFQIGRQQVEENDDHLMIPPPVIAPPARFSAVPPIPDTKAPPQPQMPSAKPQTKQSGFMESSIGKLMENIGLGKQEKPAIVPPPPVDIRPKQVEDAFAAKPIAPKPQTISPSEQIMQGIPKSPMPQAMPKFASASREQLLPISPGFGIQQTQTMPAAAKPRDDIGPVFIDYSSFKSVIDIINSLEYETKHAEDTVSRMREISADRESIYTEWQQMLENIEKDLVSMDQSLFG
jgi:hypothetical protein